MYEKSKSKIDVSLNYFIVLSACFGSLFLLCRSRTVTSGCKACWMARWTTRATRPFTTGSLSRKPRRPCRPRMVCRHYHEGQRWRGGLMSHLLDSHKLDTKRSDSSSPDWSSRFMLPSQCYTALLSKPMSPCLYKTLIGHLQTAKVSLSFCIWCAVIRWLITRQAREALVGTNLPTKNQPMICRCIIDTVYRSEN